MESQSPSGAFPFQAMVEPLVETPPLVHSLPSSCHQLASFNSGLTQLRVNYLDFHQVKDTTSFRAWSYHQVDNGARIHQQCHLLIQSNGQVGKYYIWPNNHAWRLFPRPLHIALPLMQVKGWVGKRGIGPPWFSLDLAPHSPISPITNFLVLCPPSPYPLFLVQLFISSPTFCQHICVGLILLGKCVNLLQVPKVKFFLLPLFRTFPL